MLRPPSIQSDYELYCSVDPVFAQLADNATDEQKTAYVDAWQRARETGEHTPLLAEGHALAEATKFVLRQLPGSIVRQLSDLRAKVGESVFRQLVIRLALVSIVNGPEAGKPGYHEDANLRSLGKMAPLTVVDALDSISYAIVNELAILAWVRALDVSPL